MLGLNREGELGNGSTSRDKPAPILVKNVAQATQVAAGKEHTCARLSTGAAVCWGGNVDGELGDATLTSRSLATPVYGLKGTAQVSAGGSHTCARLADSTLTCWGSDFFGQLGNGGILVGFSATPVDVIGSGGILVG